MTQEYDGSRDIKRSNILLLLDKDNPYDEIIKTLNVGRQSINFAKETRCLI
ncbi:MAG: hypothetical protein LBV42_02985 [Methanobrevibacter sp.]|jgi:predicted transcriptional regulator|nr:hypothetical protein [Methanobrevibacter sp.]